MSEKNRIKIQLSGTEFVIKAEENEDYIEKISKIVDKRIMDVANNTPNTSISMATIVTALNYCDELVKEKIKVEELNAKIEELTSRYEDKDNYANETNKKIVRYALENEQLKEEVKALEQKISMLESNTSEKKATKLNVKVIASNKNNSNKYTKNRTSNKIDYLENDKISDQYRRNDFQDDSSEEDMVPIC